jgi:photosystem II stability/assembly factor-like uncharacterized protein
MKYSRFFAAAAALMIVASANSVVADNPAGEPAAYKEVRQWNVTGPFGGSVRSLVIAPDDPGKVFVATSDGQLYRSRDGGRSWARVVPGIQQPGLVIDNLLIDPRDSDVIYIGVWAVASNERGGVYKSKDGGDSWKELGDMRGQSVRALEIGPNDSNLLVAGTLDGVYRSTDGGDDWKRISPENHPEIRNIESIAIDTRNPNSIYAGTWHLPWKTNDGGATWFPIKDGMLDDSDVFSIAVIDDNPDHVFASACSGIYFSENAGMKWAKVQGIPFASRRTRIIFPHPSRPGTVFAGTTQGLWRTQDEGKTWQLMTTKTLIVNDIDISPNTPDTILLGTDYHGVLVSSDLGQTFFESNIGFINRHVLSLLPDLTEPGRVYSTMYGDGIAGGLFISGDGGRTWRQSIKGLGGRDVFTLYQDPDKPTTLYAGTSYGVYRSANRGESWAFVGKAAKKVPVKRKKIADDDPAETPARPARRARRRGLWPAPELLAAERAIAAAPVVSPQKRRAARKPTRRTKKAPAGPPLVTLEVQVNHFARYVDVGGKRWMLAATATGLYRSENPDKGWERMKTDGLMTPYATVATDVNDPARTIFLGTSRGLALSNDFGATWERVGRGPDEESVKSIVQDPRDPKTVYVGCRGALYKTADGGRTWRKRGGGLPASDIAVVAIDPLSPDVVYAGDYLLGGVYRSRDKGESWERLDSGLPSARVWTLAPDPFDPGRLYAGSFSGGVYVLKTEGQTASTQ